MESLFRNTKKGADSMAGRIRKLHEEMNRWASTHQFDLAALNVLASIVISSKWAQIVMLVGDWRGMMYVAYGNIELWGTSHPVFLTTVSLLLTIVVSHCLSQRKKE